MPKKQTTKRPARRRKNAPKNPDIQGINVNLNTVMVDDVKLPGKPSCLCCPDCWDVPCKSCQAGDVCEMIPCACGVLYGKK